MNISDSPDQVKSSADQTSRRSIISADQTSRRSIISADQTSRRSTRAKGGAGLWTRLKMNLGGSVRLNPCGICLVLAVVFVLIFFNMGGGGGAGEMHKISLKRLLSVSIDAASRGGKEVVRIREQANIGEKSKGETLEGANNPVTDGDMLSHRAMYWSIKKSFPNLNVISEEKDVKQIDLSTIPEAAWNNPEVEARVTEDSLLPMSEVSVWIDPLDATQEYTENLREYVTTMVCVAVNGVPVIGVIHKPFSGSTSWAWAGPDYLSKTVEVAVSGNKKNVHADLAASRIIVSRSHAGEVNGTAHVALGAGIVVTPAGGAGFKALEVVNGRQDAYVHTTLIKKWDICPGAAILRAVGGRLSTLDGKDIDYSGVEGTEKNKGGVLAAIANHQKYVDKLKDLKP